MKTTAWLVLLVAALIGGCFVGARVDHELHGHDATEPLMECSDGQYMNAPRTEAWICREGQFTTVFRSAQGNLQFQWTWFDEDQIRVSDHPPTHSKDGQVVPMELLRSAKP